MTNVDEKYHDKMPQRIWNNIILSITQENVI
jgi:hypothetical protein